MTVCFHAREECVYCWHPVGRPPPMRRHRLRCVTCERWRKRSDGERCPPCSQRGFEALRLFA